ncbi:MAG: tripartite tricarboxylate transporter substrate binding protein [Burkholderiales bacterium]|nr:MAG: tripartite tricarboxylate transporter substrate binding protein [Burkholderiales bacterium]
MIKNSPSRRRWLQAATSAAALCAAGLAALGTAVAQPRDYPNKPVNIVVAFPAGSSNDALARELAQALTPLLGQTVVVTNKGGVGGVIGTDEVAKSPPDGYTIGWGTSSQLVMNAGVYKTLPFDVEKDLKQIGLVIKVPLVIVAGNRVPQTLAEFVKQAKADPKKFSYGSAGNGSVSHVMSELFLKEAGISVQHVPYRGIAPALLDVSGGNVDFAVDTLIATKTVIDQGRGHWLGIGGDKRSPSQPNLPTFAEQGFPNFQAYSWSSLFAPAKTPDAIVEKLNAAMNKAMQSPAFKARIDQVGGELLGGTAVAAEQFGARERAKWVSFIRSQNIVAE